MILCQDQADRAAEEEAADRVDRAAAWAEAPEAVWAAPWEDHLHQDADGAEATTAVEDAEAAFAPSFSEQALLSPSS